MNRRSARLVEAAIIVTVLLASRREASAHGGGFVAPPPVPTTPPTPPPPPPPTPTDPRPPPPPPPETTTVPPPPPETTTAPPPPPPPPPDTTTTPPDSTTPPPATTPTEPGATPPTPGTPSSNGPATGPGGAGGNANPVPTPGQPGGPITGDGPTRGQPRGPDDARGKGARRGVDSTDWRDWWNANAGALRAIRPMRLRVTTESALAGVGGDGEGPASPPAEAPSSRSIETLLIPTLRVVLATAGQNNTDTLASSMIGLAKVTDDPADAARITGVLTDVHAAGMDRESAALALGCLRRTKAPAAFDGHFYDKLRATLFEAIDDRQQAHRTRCFATLALGLLGDQATDDADVFAKDGRLAIRGLWMRLDRPDTDDDIAVSMLVALSLQNPRGVPTAVHDGLRRLAQTGDAGHRRRGSLPRAHALLALARLGDGDGVGIATAMVKSNSEDAHVRRSAVLAVGLLAQRIEGPDRESIAKMLIAHAKSGEPNTAGLALISAARLLSAEFAEGRVSAASLGMFESLVDVADHGNYDVRSFAAVAVGILSRPSGKALDDLGFVESRDRALDKLRHIYADDGQDPVLRGAYAVALGIAVDTRARALLEATVGQHRGSPDLAAYACAGLGLLGDVPTSTLTALRDALGDRSSEVLRREAARALGLLGDARAVPLLIAEVERGGSDHLLARAVVALGAIHDVSAIAPLCRIARSTANSDLTRALACAGLGLLADMERIPSLSLLGVDSNYMARTEALHEALSLL